MTKPSPHTLDAELARLRRALEIPEAFPPDALREAEAAARRTFAAGPEREDRTGLPLVTVDPPGSRDLDQALALERREGGGFRLWYAIADVGAFVDRGGALEAEAWRRGVTFYAPDCRVPLYPPVLSQGAASLLPDEDRPAVLFRLDTDADGHLEDTRISRALVRSRRQLTYAQAMDPARIPGAAGEAWAASLARLRPFGEARRAREAERGGVSLPIGQQHVQKRSAAALGYALEIETPVPSEEWNAQLSLLAGHAAARAMLDAGVGVLRTLPPPEPGALERFRRTARAMGFAWPEPLRYADFIRGLDVSHPRVPALVWQARKVSRGAAYVAFAGDPPADPLHHALAMPYAHVTAPLRRLADRYLLDLLVALAAGTKPTEAEVETLRRLPAAMAAAGAREAGLERRAVDLAEAFTLHGREGESFPATVLGVRDDGVEVQIEEPPVRVLVPVAAGAPRPALGDAVRVRLEAVRRDDGWLEFALGG